MGIHVVNHPLIRHKVGLLRKKNISTKDFRALSSEIARLLGYEATKDIPTEIRTIDTWSGQTTIEQIKGKKITFVPILRAGLGMMDGVFDLIPSAKVSTVGFYRDEKTLQPVQYYVKLASNIQERTALILDPMLATGGTLEATIDLLKEAGCTSIKGLFLVSAPEGVQRIQNAHPDVDIYTAALDEHLNDDGYIIPGLGDAGDKLFGTK